MSKEITMLDKIYDYVIEDVKVHIIENNDKEAGWGLNYSWSFEDKSDFKRSVFTGFFETKDEALKDVTEHIKIYGPYKHIRLFTSYFSNVDRLKRLGYTNFVSIAGKTPDDFDGRIYKDLAPKYSWWKEWKDNGYLNQWYIDKYYETVLNHLDPIKVRKDLGPDAVLLCYEKPGQFCHRRLVAKWLKDKLEDDVNEI